MDHIGWIQELHGAEEVVEYFYNLVFTVSLFFGHPCPEVILEILQDKEDICLILYNINELSDVMASLHHGKLVEDGDLS